MSVEVKGKNKKSPNLIGVAYQPSSKNDKKTACIEKIDLVLSSIKSTWNSTIILTGDTKIEQILLTYQLSCHITKQTGKGKKLINHISSNMCKKKIFHSEVLPRPTKSDHDAPYIIVNIWNKKTL